MLFRPPPGGLFYLILVEKMLKKVGNAGIAFAVGAYAAWGLFPLYFLQVAGIPAWQVVAHRTVWSLAFVIILLTLLRRWAWLPLVLRQPRVLALFAASALLLSCNWLVYVWAVQNRHVVDASLGYFILPLVSVALGFVVLHERPRFGQWAAVALAALGVVWLTIQSGTLPWIALVLAASFGAYGLMRKTAPLGALEGFALETLLLAPLALAGLVYWHWQGVGAWQIADASKLAWLVAGGPLTAIPLLLFAAGARRIPLATMGMLQYISPTLQFALGIWIFNEPQSAARLIGFALIWAALLVYSLEGLWRNRRNAASPAG